MEWCGAPISRVIFHPQFTHLFIRPFLGVKKTPFITGFVCQPPRRDTSKHHPRQTPHPWDLCPSAGLVAECQDIHISRCTTQRGTLEACGTQQHPPRFPERPWKGLMGEFWEPHLVVIKKILIYIPSYHDKLSQLYIKYLYIYTSCM